MSKANSKDGKYQAIGNIKINGELVEDGARFDCDSTLFVNLKASKSAVVYGAKEEAVAEGVSPEVAEMLDGAKAKIEELEGTISDLVVEKGKIAEDTAALIEETIGGKNKQIEDLELAGLEKDEALTLSDTSLKEANAEIAKLKKAAKK